MIFLFSDSLLPVPTYPLISIGQVIIIVSAITRTSHRPKKFSLSSQNLICSSSAVSSFFALTLTMQLIAGQHTALKAARFLRVF